MSRTHRSVGGFVMIGHSVPMRRIMKVIERRPRKSFTSQQTKRRDKNFEERLFITHNQNGNSRRPSVSAYSIDCGANSRC